jgi:hypothetical protein
MQTTNMMVVEIEQVYGNQVDSVEEEMVDTMLAVAVECLQYFLTQTDQKELLEVTLNP